MDIPAASLPYLRIALVTAAATVFLRQMFGARSAFKLPDETNPLSVPVLIAIGANAIALFLASVAPLNRPYTVAGLAGLAVSLALFEWARHSIRGRTFTVFFTDDTPQFLWTEGPYAYVRNPFYTSYLLAYASIAVALQSFAAAALLAGMTVFYHLAALREEHKFARSALAADFAAYKRRTGRFLPRIIARSRDANAA
jgi:protein-S-isoprenylcysteine O-methyltransferase Ste14